MHKLITDKQTEIAKVCQHYRVARLEVYGSAARGTDFDPDHSDADFLVEFLPSSEQGLFDRFMGLLDDLKTVLGRPVDLGEAEASRNKYMQASIETDLETVYEA